MTENRLDLSPPTALDAPLRVALKAGLLATPSPVHGTILRMKFYVGARIRDLPVEVRWDDGTRSPFGDHVFGDLKVVEAADHRIETILNSRWVRRVRVRREKVADIERVFQGKAPAVLAGVAVDPDEEENEP